MSFLSSRPCLSVLIPEVSQVAPSEPTKGPLVLPSFISLSSSPEEADAPDTPLAETSQVKGTEKRYPINLERLRVGLHRLPFLGLQSFRVCMCVSCETYEDTTEELCFFGFFSFLPLLQWSQHNNNISFLKKQLLKTKHGNTSRF